MTSVPQNPPELNGVEDLSALVYLEMPNVLFNMMYRFLKLPKKEIYTCVSTILLAMNPYEWLLYLVSEEMIALYKKHQDSGDLLKTPQPYAVSSRAYVRMVARKKPQSLLCCGISGAGKSECAKQLIRYLAKTSPMGEGMVTEDPEFIVNQIVQASIILEAWGNAKTTLNNNSSRFGKFVKLMYKEGKILGSWMETYLLEKSRVIAQGPQERNYHIFYFIFKGLSGGALDAMSLSKPSDFWYLKQGGCTEVDGIDDKKEFGDLMESLKLFRFSDDDLTSIWNLTAGILHVGQCAMKEDDSGNAQCDPGAKINMDLAAELWGISSDSLNERLTTASMEVMKKTIIKKVAPAKYNDNRDAISKALFENSFLFVVERINGELFHLGSGDVKKIMFIGVLDIFGFENFITNSIEQFCINFTNEKIQGYFNYNIIASEQEEYIKESVLWKPMKVPDNSDFVEMIEHKKNGMFALLDSACKAPKPSPENFVKEFFKKQGKMKQYLEKAKGPKKAKGQKKKKKEKKGDRWVGFLIHHFCDDVIYTANLYLEKNMDAIHPDTAKMFAKSKYPMVQMIGAGTHHKKKKKKKKAKSVCGFFSAQLINLITTLNITEPYFCRAMKPNWTKSKADWDDTLVEDQLRSGGLIEALRVLKLGYPTRVPYQKIWDKFNGKIKNPLVNNLGQMGFAQAVLMAFGVDETTYELGLTKIFFKPAKAAVLDEIMASADKPMSAEQNEMIVKFVQQKRTKQMVGAVKVFLKLSLRIRFKRARENMAKWGRVLGMVSRTVVRHADYAKNAMKIKAAQQIQAFFRSKDAMRTAGPQIAEKKTASVTVFQMWRRFEERSKLLQWLTENCGAAKARAEELKNMSPEERAAREEKRKAERAAKAAEMAAAAAAADDAKNAAAADAEAAAAAARDAAAAQQNAANISLEDADKIARQAAAEKAEALRLAQEKAQRDKENSELWKLLHPEGSDEEEEYEDEETGEKKVRKVVDFKKEASHGHMFTVYHARKNRSPHERFVKVDFKDGEPQNISWGSGDRSINWADIKFVVRGIKTNTMKVWSDQADDGHVFSVVSNGKTLDCQASDDHSRDVWVDGLTKMLGQSEEDRAAAQEAYDPNAEEVADVEKPREKTASQLQTQANLFNMIIKTTFREINYEGLYGFLGEPVQAEFKDPKFYAKCQAENVPWRDWETWVRSEVCAYITSNGLADAAVVAAHEEEVAAKRASGAEPISAEPKDDCMIA